MSDTWARIMAMLPAKEQATNSVNNRPCEEARAKPGQRVQTAYTPKPQPKQERDVWAEVIEDAKREAEASERFKRRAKEAGRSTMKADSPYPMPPKEMKMPEASTTNLVPGCRWIKTSKGQAHGGSAWKAGE